MTLNNLDKLGLLQKQEGKSPWDTIKNKLELINFDMDIENSMYDTHSVHAGYAPLSVRIIEEAHSKRGWKGIEHLLNLLPGPHVEKKQVGAMGMTFLFLLISIEPQKKVILIFFIGGVTNAEISAIRYLAEHESTRDRQYVIATTKLINGNTFIQSLFENVGNIKKKHAMQKENVSSEKK